MRKFSEVFGLICFLAVMFQYWTGADWHLSAFLCVVNLQIAALRAPTQEPTP